MITKLTKVEKRNRMEYLPEIVLTFKHLARYYDKVWRKNADG